MTKQEQLDSIISYIEYAGLTFIEPFSLISATVVEASYWTGIPKNTILIYINKTFKTKYGEKFIKCQMLAHEIAYGNNPNEEKIMARSLDKPKEPKERKEREATTEIGKAFKEYTGLNSKANRGLYVACNNYFNKYHEFPWLNKKKWDRMCKRNNFVDKNIEEKVEK
jgi:hypothetical protein